MDMLKRMGWKDGAAIKGRYAFERNSVDNWQINDMMPYMFPTPSSNTMIWLAGDNPNYNVHLLALSLVLKW